MSGTHYTEFIDPPERIAVCLSCTRPECVDCWSRGDDGPQLKIRINKASERAAAIARYCNDTSMTDAEIADALGISLSAVCLHRRKLGLPTHARRSVRKEIDRCIIELNEQGFSDHQIATTLCIAQSTVTTHRAELGLAAPSARARRARDEQLKSLYEQGLTDAEIGSRIGITSRAVFDRRRKLGLASKRKKGGK